MSRWGTTRGDRLLQWAGIGVLAVALAAVNVFGGFLVTRRMLEMFRKKEPRKLPAAAAPANAGK